jgi:ABC-type dipeptide/oligopeptide/nickel transport system permease component
MPKSVTAELAIVAAVVGVLIGILLGFFIPANQSQPDSPTSIEAPACPADQ